MKRLLPGCAVVLAVGLAACGSSSSSSGNTSGAGSASTPASGTASSGGSSSGSATTGASSSSSSTKKLKIALVTGDNHDPFYVTMNKGAQAAAAKLNATVTWQGPAVYGAQAQIQILDPVLSSKPDGLLVAPDDTKALIPTLQSFNKAKIPVMTVDTDVLDKSVRLGNITSNNALGGKLAAQYLEKNLPHGSTVVYVGEPTGISTTDERAAGFAAAVKASGGALKALSPQFGTDDDPNTATSVVSALLQRNPDLKGIFASDTSWGQGAATAIQQAGKIGQVKVVAFDAEPAEVQGLSQGTIQALIVQKAYDEGVDAVTDIVNYIRSGKKPPAETEPPFVIATKANIDSPSVKKYIYAQK